MNYGKVADIFKADGFEWNFSDGRRIPDAKEIEKTVVSAVNALREAEDNTQIEVGRLIIKRKGSYFDVYLHAGVLK